MSKTLIASVSCE